MVTRKKVKFFNIKLIVLLIIALVLRLVLMPTSAHSDLLLINVFPNVLLTNNVVDIYSYINQNSAVPGFQYYPPLTYFSFAFFQYLFHFISASYGNWMGSLLPFVEGNKFSRDFEYFTKVQNPHLLQDLFLAKTPYLLFDTASVLVLMKLARQKLISKYSILVWVFNPVLLYGTYIFGQFDIIPVFFVVLGFYLLRKNPYLGVLSLGIGIAYKIFPVIYLLPVILIYSNTKKEFFKLLAFAIMPILIAFVPIFLFNNSFDLFSLVPKVFFHNKRTLDGWTLYSTVFKYTLLLFSYLFLLFISFILKLRSKWNTAVSLSLCSILLVLTLSPRTTFYYLIWATPLIFLYFKNTKQIALVILIESISFALFKLLGSSIQFELFAPLNPELFTKLPTVNSLINQVIPYNIVSTLSFTIFFTFNLSLIMRIFVNAIFSSEIRLSKKVNAVSSKDLILK